MLSKAELQHELGVSVIGRKLFVFEEIDSTNLCAKVMADAGTEEGAVVIADHQTAGRGRRGRTWVDARGDNLLYSILLRPALSTDDLARLTFLVATAVARTVHATGNLTAECKWPNDVLIDGKKVCGILVENGVANGIAQ
ncbi:MAG: biotin--[acetyl-CoA-carboxylase] ligase, partial [Ignavibacteriales bacterium]|nr:biotin--[acetyl-CoA-carboxylase] ligase [Ignavibacteriales bacterium]